ncbi:MAG: hypothetical protein H7333_10755 [Bdellovibrionales bacterium]|nr:hypothetical protein [Oligoflexia bacterium]
MNFRTLSMNRVWLGFFAIWSLLLSGLLDAWVQSPGLKQWMRVGETLKERRQEIADVEARTVLFQSMAKQLESNSVAQEREIRKVLGYLGEQELVFEFTPKE